MRISFFTGAFHCHHNIDPKMDIHKSAVCLEWGKDLKSRSAKPHERPREFACPGRARSGDTLTAADTDGFTLHFQKLICAPKRSQESNLTVDPGSSPPRS